jgi:hypothetical protein
MDSSPQENAGGGMDTDRTDTRSLIASLGGLPKEAKGRIDEAVRLDSGERDSILEAMSGSAGVVDDLAQRLIEHWDSLSLEERVGALLFLAGALADSILARDEQ